jgi:chromosome segregation protein
MLSLLLTCILQLATCPSLWYNAALIIMRLKHLELQGFKTFASKTEFVFPTGITAIVGPNGSGKSNIADAIRWVLGEQVFSILRAKKTEDLVFAGSEHRPRSGMAEVYLTLDNSDGFFPIDFSEIVVGRRAYRDGENEYMLNGSKVRLRDINELLSKTGLAQRTYTVIGQGLVDQALSLNSEERRALFEEAAGISMYRHKREDALRKLEETNRNLERVRDILAEIGPRVRQLERQAQRSSDYVRLSAELIEMQRTWFGYHWGLGQKALSEAKQTAEAQSGSLNTRRVEMTALNDRIAAARQKQFELRQQINAWQRESSGLRSQEETLQRQLAVLNERARSLQQQLDQFTSDNAPLEAQAASQQHSLAQAETELAQLIDRTNQQATLIASAKQALIDRQTQREAIVQSRSETQAAIVRSQAAQTDRAARRSDLAARRSILQRDMEQHRHDIAARGEQSIALQAQRTSIENEIAQLEAQRADLAQQIDQLSQQLDAAKRLAEQKETELNQARGIESRLRERFKILSEVRASLSSFDAGTRFVLSANLSGVRGALATLINVDPKWERAIEAALGTDIQAIVVESWDVAESIQAKLGEKSGRVSLLPLEILSGNPDENKNRGLFAFLRRAPKEAPAIIEVPRGTKRASEVVKAESNLQAALDLLLGNVVLAETLKDARQMRKTLPAGISIVTRKGEVLKSAGTITLGDIASEDAGMGMPAPQGRDGTLRAMPSGFLAQQREWKELPARIDEATKVATTANDAHAEVLKSIEALVQQQTALTSQSQSIESSITPKIDQRRTVEFQAEDVRREIGWKQGVIDQVTNDIAAIDKQGEQLQAEEQLLLTEIQQHQQSMQQLETQLLDLPLDALTTQLNSIQAEAAVAEQLRRSQTSVVASYKAALDQIRAQLQGRTDRANRIGQEQQSINAQLSTLQQNEKSIHDQLAAFSEKIDPAEKSLRELEIDQHQLETEERSARNRLQEMESIYNQAVVDLTRKEEELNHLHSRIDEELGLVQLEMADLTGPQPLPLTPIVSELPTVEFLPEGMDQELPRLKAQIRRLGAINPEAQKEFEEARDRFEFLGQQSGDLEKAIEQLNQVIVELDQLMQITFRETFEKIAEEFKIQFQKLFGGGTAKLVLTDPENISVTGIEVIARPPGKKQQSLALLSGGERSLTAAALMFSILRVKPPPFCILDETDAALDEANVGRFRDTIKALSDSTQFVMITHNRGTIEAADTIYGISMANDSASRAISLKLEAIKEQGG